MMTSELIGIILHILMVVAVFMSLPLVFKIVYGFTRLLWNVIDPIKVIEIETTFPDGHKETTTVKLDNSDELVQALLKQRGLNVK